MSISHFGQSASVSADANDGAIGNEQGGVACCAKAAANKPGILRLDAVDPTTAVVTPYYLWVDSTGDLRIHTAIPSTEVSDGSVVGGQS